MKIGIISIQNSCNYGAVLQTFAAQESYAKHGQVEIINYQNTHTDKTTKKLRFGKTPRDILRFGKDFLRLLPKIRSLKKFESFFNTHYKLSGAPTQDLSAMKNSYDFYVCGSDQIWNPQIISEDGTIDSNYFLAFTDSKNKISYASSKGSYNYTPEEKKLVTSLLNDFQDISVRESDAAEFFSNELNRPVEHVLDPTLLLSKSEWLDSLNIKNDLSKKPYILVYVLRKNKILSQTVQTVAKIHDLDIITIDQDPFTTMRCDKHINDAGPVEFIELFSNASFVITNSFHGCAFSVNFNIPFIITPPPTGLNRIMSLLEAVGAEHRAIKTHDDAIKLAKEHVNFESINTKLQAMRLESHQYIENSIKTGSSSAAKSVLASAEI